jgi:hypothetical protein
MIGSQLHFTLQKTAAKLWLDSHDVEEFHRDARAMQPLRRRAAGKIQALFGDRRESGEGMIVLAIVQIVSRRK